MNRTEARGPGPRRMIAPAEIARAACDRLRRRADLRHHRLRLGAHYDPAREPFRAAPVRARAVRARRPGRRVARGAREPAQCGALRMDTPRADDLRRHRARVTLLVNLPRAVGMLLLGVFVLSFALYSLVRRPRARRVISSRWVWLAGFVGGITSTLFGAGGPPYVIYLSQRGLTKEQFRATLGFDHHDEHLAAGPCVSRHRSAARSAGLDCRRGRGPAAFAGIWCRGACFGSSRATCCCAP